MKKTNKIIWLFAFLLVLSCEVTDLDKQTDPNSPSPENLDPDFTLNSIQVNFANFFQQMTESTGEAVRLEYMFDTYEVNYNSSNANLQNAWSAAYASVFEDVKTLLDVASENELHIHSGVARTLKAYIMLTLVDTFGDVPYSEANLGTENLFPSVDDGASVYDAALAELNLALTDFNNVTSGTQTPPSELFYNNDVDQWINFINTLIFKYHLNRRLIDPAGAAVGVQGILADGNFISSSSDDFVWNFSTADDASKHQYYIEEYLAASTGEYMTNYLMWTMAVEKDPVEDPRLRYYFYRQVDEFPGDDATLDNEIDCHDDERPVTYGPIDAISAQPLPFCSLFGRGDGYWGRDHSNNQGIPPDNTKRTTFGTYPVGGRFDDDEAESISANEGLDGAGIWPIMMDSFVYFMRAEAALYLSTGEDPRVMLETGVRNSIVTVMSFLPNPSDFTNIPDAAAVDAYIAEVLNLYDAAGTDDERMAVIGKEYFIAMFGNGIEGYNLYRRTGTPINLQPTLLGTGNFPRSFFYPNNSVNSNPSITQKGDLTVPVFWDNGSAVVY